MRGFSCPPLSCRPFQEAAALVLPHFELWEIVSEADHFLPDIEAQARELLDTTHLRLSVHAPYSVVNLAAFDERTRRFSVKVLCDTVETAGRLGIGPVTVHPGILGPIQRYDRERTIRLTKQGLREIAEAADDCGVQACLENMPSMKACICQTAAEMRDMLDGLDMGMCFDIGHANTTGQIPELLEMAKDFANIHVHDNDGAYDQHRPLGKGNIDFSALKHISYWGNHIIEAADPGIDDALASKNFLQGIIG
jgi:sugar phosphate isomerase/epimerase